MNCPEELTECVLIERFLFSMTGANCLESLHEYVFSPTAYTYGRGSSQLTGPLLHLDSLLLPVRASMKRLMSFIDV